MKNEKLALLGGTPTIPKGMIPAETLDKLFRQMVLTKEAEDAAMDVIRRGAFSGTDITEKFQNEFA